MRWNFPVTKMRIEKMEMSDRPGQMPPARPPGTKKKKKICNKFILKSLNALFISCAERDRSKEGKIQLFGAHSIAILADVELLVWAMHG